MLSALLVGILVLATEDASQTDEQRREAVSRIAPAKARQLEVASGVDSVRAALVERPLLRWSNPTAGSVFGEVFVWTAAERPVAIASIYRWYHPLKDSTVEVVSVSEQAVAAREGSSVLWQAPADGVSFHVLPDAPRPAASAAARLGQLRVLAREFSAELADQRSGERVVRELRLLNQPVHRYANASAGLIDGGLFAFVETTDPEAWLLLEAREHEGKSAWHYALARMNADELLVRRGTEKAAAWPKLHQPWRFSSAHYTLFGFDPALTLSSAPIEPKRD